MSTSTKPTAIPTDLLCTGLYVVELDRPWIETPFLFQGFRISSDEELRVLRETCRHVYIDSRRCEREALRTLKEAAARRKAVRQADGASKPPPAKKVARMPRPVRWRNPRVRCLPTWSSRIASASGRWCRPRA